MKGAEGGAPEHVEAGPPGRAASENPLARGLNVTVSIPESLEIRMVEASALEEYEIWFLISSILSSAVIGFGVAYLQDMSHWSLLYTSLTFLLLLVISVGTALLKRARLRAKSKTIQLTAFNAREVS